MMGVGMSIAGLGAVAAVRDERDVTRGDTGKAVGDDANDVAKTRDLVATLVPTGAIAGYSALLAVVIEYIEGETKKGNAPGNFGPLRWTLFGAFLLATAWLVAMAHRKRRSGSGRRFPKDEVIVALLAATAWGLSGPGTPLALVFSGLNAVLIPSAVLIGVFLLLTPLVPKLKKRATN
jgi:hypothetical protein